MFSRLACSRAFRVATVGGSMGTVVAAKAYCRPANDDPWTSLKQFWERYKPLPVIREIIGVNFAVFLLWRVPRFNGFMYRHFTCSLQNLRQGRVYTLLTACFSHATPLHFLFNNMALYSMGPLAMPLFSPDVGDFLNFYVGTGVVSTLCAVLFQGLRAVVRRAQPFEGACLGASGCVYGVFALVACMYPKAEFVLIFLPTFPINAGTLFPVMCAFESVACVYSLFRQSPLAHAAHLSGAGIGYAYFLRNKDYFDDNLVKLYKRLWR